MSKLHPKTSSLSSQPHLRASKGSLMSLSPLNRKGMTASMSSLEPTYQSMASKGSVATLNLTTDKSGLSHTPNLIEEFIIQTQCIVYSIKIDPLFKYVAIALQDGSVQIISLQDQKLLHSLTHSSTEGKPITCISFRPQNPKYKDKSVLAVSCTSGKIIHYHYTSKQCIGVINEGDHVIHCIRYDASGEKFVTGGTDCMIRVYDGITHQVIFQSRSGAGGHSNYIYATLFDPTDNTKLVSGGWDSTLKIWDTETGNSKDILGPHVCGEAIDFGSDGELFTASHSKDHTLQQFHLDSGKKETFHWYKRGLQKYCPLNTLKTSTYSGGSVVDGLNQTGKLNDQQVRLIFCAGGTGGLGEFNSGEVRVLNQANKKCVASVENIPGAVNSVDYANELMVFGGTGMQVYFFSLKGVDVL